MVATLLLATGDIELASDGVDKACARALARWSRVSAMDAPTGWAYRVALNHARRVARRRRLERLVLRRVPPPPNVPAAAGEIWALVAELPLRQRQVVVVRHVADLREAEIAGSLGISRSTVSTTLRDAHNRLGHLLDPAPGPETNNDKEATSARTFLNLPGWLRQWSTGPWWLARPSLSCGPTTGGAWCDASPASRPSWPWLCLAPSGSLRLPLATRGPGRSWLLTSRRA